MKITYLGHAAFKVKEDGKSVWVDPWLSGPTCPMSINDVKEADLVLVTHDHGDHGISEALQICKKTDAVFIAINELGLLAKEKGVKNVHTLNIGGSVSFNGMTIILVQAFHSCAEGAPTGFVIRFPKASFYHAGDTGVFSSMELIKELYNPDVAMLPIGSYYTMDVKQAAIATKLLKPRFVIPMHYNTFPVIEADPEVFKRLVNEAVDGVEVEIMKPGETNELNF